MLLNVMIHVALIGIQLPAFASYFFGQIMTLLTFQFFDPTNFLTQFLHLDANGNESFTEQFGLLGYSSYYFLVNQGTMVFTFFLLPAAWLSVCLLDRILKHQNERVKSWRVILTNQMFYNNLIQLIWTNFLFTGVCVGINT
jgi:hypothetical protein